MCETNRRSSKMSNNDIRNVLKKENIYMWQIAEKLEMHETTLIKKFRRELSKDQKMQIISAVESIKLSRMKEEQEQD